MNQREAFEKWFQEEMDFYRYGIEYSVAKSAWDAAMNKVPLMQWQPIDTAPKDGTSILGYTAEGICEISWVYGEWSQSPCYSTYDGCGSAVLLCNPTHWMPLPPAP